MHAELIIRAGEGAGRAHRLEPGGRLVLGRGAELPFRLLDHDASREHAALELTPAGLSVTDLGSRNGTLLGQQRLTPHRPQLAAPRDELRIGTHVLELRVIGAAATPAQGRVRDEFESLGELGSGAAGKVFAARHRASGREVAIKVLLERAAEADDQQARARFQRESRIRVQCPHVVEVYDVRVEDGQVFLIMELVRGRSLDERLRSEGPLPIPEALQLGEQIAAGLDAAHRAGFVHRDVKPGNVLLTPAGQAKLGDFGLAKELGASQALTATGQGMGSLAYVAPEQAADAKRVDGRADLYALGATLYHLIAGEPPFQPAGLAGLAEILATEPPPLTGRRPDCPRRVASVIHMLLEKDPEDRPQSAAQVVRTLQRLRAKLFAK